MSADSATRLASLERLSALVDGELDAAAVPQTCAQWRDDAGMRVSWHEYQLIGDVLRSDDLASGAGHDAAFMAALRARLADEPVVLAPQARTEVVAPQGRRWGWLAPSAVAAGFVMVAGVLVMTRGPNAPVEPNASTTLAAAPAPAPAPALTLAPAPAPLPALTVEQAASPSPQSGVSEAGNPPAATVVSGQVLRDARLDRYLAAHKQFAGSSALGVPSAFLRRATADASNR